MHDKKNPMSSSKPQDLQPVNDIASLWQQVFMVFPLAIIGSKEPDGSYDLAPKHMAMPLSWENHFGFVCTPTHATYTNIKNTGEFTVSYPRAEQVVFTSLTASPRCDDKQKRIIDALPTIPATEVDGVFIKDAYLYLECKLDRVIDDFGKNSLITGTIELAHVDKRAQRHSDLDDEQLLHANPLLAYLYPGRFATISDTKAFPFPDGFKR